MARTIKKIVIHCTDSEDSLDIGAREIRDWHVNGNGWSDIGYHFVVRRDGSVETGRPLYQSGAHVKGHNKNSIGICWVGRDKPTRKQETTLLCLSRALMEQYRVKLDDVLGHKELDHLKTCPNLDMVKFRGHLLFTKIDFVPRVLIDMVKP